MRTVVAIPTTVKRDENSPPRTELRRRLADAAESIIALLDALDGDPDAEDDGAGEPSLGWTRTAAWGSADDREEDRVPVG